MAFDAFLKIDGIPGESTDDKHKNEIQLESFSWGAQQTGTRARGGGGGAGKVAMDDFSFVMRMNKASPKLMLSCANGTHIKSAILTCRKAGKDQQEYLKFTFSDLLVSNYETGGSHAADLIPVDKVSINFSKVEFEYKEQKASGALGGTVKTGWDLKTNKKI